MDTTKTITHVSLCTGYGGIELGLGRAIRNLRTVALCEIEAFAIANLVAKMEAGLMDPAPIWPDLKTFPWECFRQKVDLLSGGYPCQPFSSAGQRKGKDDPRHLWPWIADGIGIVRPTVCFFENVEGHVSLGLSTVISDLEELGYKVAWGLFSAAEVGAPHQRKRVFILAVSSGIGSASRISGSLAWNEGEPGESDNGRNQGQPWPSRPGEQQYGWEPPRVISGRETLDDSEERTMRNDGDDQRQTVGTCDTTDNSSSCSGESELANSKCPNNRCETCGNQIGEQNTERSSSRSGGPSCSKIDHLRQTQSSLGGDADGTSDRLDDAELYVSTDNRTDELRLLGNGVVPIQAALAFTTLYRELKQ